MKEITFKCKMKYNGFIENLKVNECRELFECNKDNINCSNCPCLIIERETSHD